MNEPSRSAQAGVVDIARLAVRLAGGLLRGSRNDAGATAAHWMRDVMAGDHAGNVAISIGSRHIEIVGNRERSDRILSGPPATSGCPVGRMKRNAMSFLAERALTVTDGPAWTGLRAFNEGVLGTGGPHPFAQAFLGRVRSAFARPVADMADIRKAMGRAMSGIVLGDAADDSDAATDVTVLFGVVASPIRRKLFASRYTGRRNRFRALLARCWESSAADAPTLIALARNTAADADQETLLQQVPHWMFTFTGSGTDLLTRTLAMITARPAVLRRVRDEMAAAGPLDQAESYAQMPLLDACILETGRLFPPVTRTFHLAAAGTGRPETELVHWFPLLQRDDGLGANVHHFVPDRWLTAERDAAAAASNLFLRGPRSCPGADLILFVCRAALVRLLAELNVRGTSRRLARDPLPVSFPAREARFTVSEARP
ncbi:MAG: cytochrome P450 [Gemmatimonadetes bacterium]|nr:cytochrome P450 [Gemmatimonadota bacterium]